MRYSGLIMKQKKYGEKLRFTDVITPSGCLKGFPEPTIDRLLKSSAWITRPVNHRQAENEYL
jgi:hypothetical protein